MFSNVADSVSVYQCDICFPMFADSVSVYQVLDVVNDDMFKRKCLMEN